MDLRVAATQGGPIEREWLSRRSAAIVGLGLLIIMVDGFDLQSIGFVVPEIARAWGLPLSAFGPVFGAGVAGTIPGAMLAGPLAARIGARRLLAIALAVFGAGTLATALVTDVGTLVAMRFVVGIGLGAAVPLVMTFVANEAPQRWRATMVVATLCGQPAGAILGSMLCGVLIPKFGWQSAFLLGGAAPLLLIPLLRILPARGVAGATTRAEVEGRVSDLVSLRWRATTLALWSATFMSVLTLYLVINWLPGIVRDEGHGLQTSILAIGLFNGGAVAGALLLAWLVDRIGAFRVMPAAFGLGALALAALSPARADLSYFYLAAIVAGLCSGGAAAALGAVAIACYPLSLRTTGTGWTMGVGRLGAVVGPLGIGLALSLGLAGHRLFLVAGMTSLAAALVMVVLGRVSADRPEAITEPRP
jgi:AAHS family 4-hydroxybenzoate transporter-like MFS transporter